ncbi:hypothetical protein OQA88_12135 [Cercophora sp. LCS_1]
MSSQGSLLKYIYVVLGLYVADGIISLSFLSSMVAWLQKSGGAGPFTISYPEGSTFLMSGEPEKLLTNHGHVTNGAGGTAVVLVGFGGLIALLLENKSRNKYGKSSGAFTAWTVMVILSTLLTLTALIYTFVLQSKTGKQVIDLAEALRTAFPAKYDVDSWTPENWYKEVLNLPLTNAWERRWISYNLRIMRGWKYNLIALFVVGFILSTLVIVEQLRIRKSRIQYSRAASGNVYDEQKYGGSTAYGGANA